LKSEAEHAELHLTPTSNFRLIKDLEKTVRDLMEEVGAIEFQAKNKALEHELAISRLKTELESLAGVLGRID